MERRLNLGDDLQTLEEVCNAQFAGEPLNLTPRAIDDPFVEQVHRLIAVRFITVLPAGHLIATRWGWNHAFPEKVQSVGTLLALFAEDLRDPDSEAELRIDDPGSVRLLNCLGNWQELSPHRDSSGNICAYTPTPQLQFFQPASLLPRCPMTVEAVRPLYGYGAREFIGLEAPLPGRATNTGQISNATFRNCRFSAGKLGGSNFTNCIFDGCAFDGADLRATSFLGCTFKRSNFLARALEGTRIHDCKFLIGTKIDREAVEAEADFRVITIGKGKVYNRALVLERLPLGWQATFRGENHGPLAGVFVPALALLLEYESTKLHPLELMVAILLDAAPKTRGALMASEAWPALRALNGALAGHQRRRLLVALEMQSGEVAAWAEKLRGEDDQRRLDAALRALVVLCSLRAAGEAYVIKKFKFTEIEDHLTQVLASSVEAGEKSLGRSRIDHTRFKSICEATKNLRELASLRDNAPEISEFLARSVRTTEWVIFQPSEDF